MENKFKIGDVVKNWMSTFTVIDIVFDKKTISGNWPDGKKIKPVENCYFLIDNRTKLNFYSKFGSENSYSIIKSSIQPETIIENNSCPRCNGNLINKFSEYSGTTIKKCNSCGWC